MSQSLSKPKAVLVEIAQKLKKMPTKLSITTKSSRSQRIADRWHLGSKIGSGAYGEVFEATDSKQLLKKKTFAVKIEPQREMSSGSNSLQKEYIIYRDLAEQTGINVPVGVTKVHYYGKWRGMNVLVMCKHGPSLRDIIDKEGAFLMKQVLSIGMQVLVRIRYIHSKGYLHRDIKPRNIVTGLNDKKELYIIDFGLAKRFLVGERRKHIKHKESRPLVGTTMFCSARAHEGIELSRRDDLESLGYTLVYLSKFSLPWEYLKNLKGHDFGDVVGKAKHHTSLAQLCKGLPSEIREYFEYVLRLQFEQEPDYDMIYSVLRKAFDRLA